MAHVTYAQEPVDHPIGYFADEGITPRSGSLSYESIPVNVYVPNGYKYIDNESTRKILVDYWGNGPAQVENVLGMIIPDGVNSVEGIDRAWIVSYYRPGHVRDADSGNEDFSWLLDELRRYPQYEGSELEWAWKPAYDKKKHQLSLPVMIVTGTDTVLDYKRIIFGSEGAVQVEPVVDIADASWLRGHEDDVSDAIIFKVGARYEDFDEKSQPSKYESVSDFIRGYTGSPSDYVYYDEESVPEEDSDKSLLSLLNSTVIKAIGIVILVLLCIMLILMACVAMTNKKGETAKEVKRSSMNVLLRIGVFAMVYLLIFTLSVFLIWAGINITILVVTNYISARGIFIIISCWIVLLGFLFTVIKSLFVFTRYEYPERFEIVREDAPELFALIEEVSAANGEMMPRHVYISTDVNACVFYDKPLRSLFISRRKNIEIGLGLMFGLNRQELKAVIAHEYGHFSQRSMRIGQVVSASVNVISNIYNAERTSLVRPVLKMTSLYVRRGYMTLSRSMEYEADLKGANVAGRRASISALCKLEVMDSRLNAYRSLMYGIYESKHKLPESYWAGYIQFLSLGEGYDGVALDESVTAAHPLTTAPGSKINLKNPWTSHPLLHERIENITRSCDKEVEYGVNKTKDLVPQEVYDRSSILIFSNAGYTHSEVCSAEEYLALLKAELGERSFPLALRPFFSRDFSGFEWSREEVERNQTRSEDVFTPANARLIETFSQSIEDYRTLAMFIEGRTTEKEIQYEGKVYIRKTVPVEAHVEMMKKMEPAVAAIDKGMFLAAMAMARDKHVIETAYDNIFYTQEWLRHLLDELLPLRDSVIQKVRNWGNVNEENFDSLSMLLIEFKGNVRETIGSLDMDRLAPVMHVDMVSFFERIDDSDLFEDILLLNENMEYVFSVPDHLVSLLQNLNYYSKKLVSDTIEGKPLLMYWNNSVASRKSGN